MIPIIALIFMSVMSHPLHANIY